MGQTGFVTRTGWPLIFVNDGPACLTSLVYISCIVPVTPGRWVSPLQGDPL